MATRWRQVFFEILNSRDRSLFGMVLVRNNIFYRVGKQSSATFELYKQPWDPFDAS